MHTTAGLVNLGRLCLAHVNGGLGQCTVGDGVGVLWDTEGCSMVVECTPARLAAAASAAAAGLEKGYPAPFMPSGYPGNPNGGRTVPVMIQLITLEK